MLNKYIPMWQFVLMNDALRAKTTALIAQTPLPYATEDVEADDKIIQLHYTVDGCHWWICEVNPDDQIAFGFVVLNGDWDCAEWGYIPLDELVQLGIPLDLEWVPKKFSEIEEIKANVL